MLPQALNMEITIFHYKSMHLLMKFEEINHYHCHQNVGVKAFVKLTPVWVCCQSIEDNANTNKQICPSGVSTNKPLGKKQIKHYIYFLAEIWACTFL